MHIKGTSLTMQNNPIYENLIQEIKEKLKRLIEKAEEAGIKKENIIIDPGLGFGKTAEHNLEILNQLYEFKELGQPILVGPSRKSFIGKLLGTEPDKRIFGTAASVAIAIKNGADIIRVHDVKEIKQVAILADAIVRGGDLK
jgi:dihydropteroate synthase